MNTFKIFCSVFFCLALVSACGQVTPEQMAELDRQSAGRSQANPSGSPTTSSTIKSIQYDSRGSVDILYSITPTGSVYTFNITRVTGSTVAKTATLNATENPELYALLKGIFEAKVTATSRAECSDCMGWNTLLISRQDGSATLYNYPTLNNTTVTTPFEKLNQYLIGRF